MSYPSYESRLVAMRDERVALVVGAGAYTSPVVGRLQRQVEAGEWAVIDLEDAKILATFHERQITYVDFNRSTICLRPPNRPNWLRLTFAAALLITLLSIVCRFLLR